MLSKGNWLAHDHFNNMPITEYFNILSFELTERKNRDARLNEAMIRSKGNPMAFQTALLMEILAVL